MIVTKALKIEKKPNLEKHGRFKQD